MSADHDSTGLSLEIKLFRVHFKVVSRQCELHFARSYRDKQFYDAFGGRPVGGCSCMSQSKRHVDSDQECGCNAKAQGWLDDDDDDGKSNRSIA